MKLDIEALRAVTLGAVKVEADENGFHFHRFTDEQIELYKTTWMADKVYSTAGIKLCFRTDSQHLSLKFDIKKQAHATFLPLIFSKIRKSSDR